MLKDECVRKLLELESDLQDIQKELYSVLQQCNREEYRVSNTPEEKLNIVCCLVRIKQSSLENIPTWCSDVLKKYV